MQPRLHPSCAFLASVVIIITTIHFQTISCQRTQPYEVCGRLVQCGNTTLHYPFWGVDRPVYCGHLGFEITCRNNVTLLHYESLSFRVLKINIIQQTITVARDDLWSSYCPQYLYNTTYDSNLFNDDNFAQEDVTLYYRCDSSSGVLMGHSFNCGVKDNEKNNYFIGTSMIDNNMLNNSVQCTTQITVPVIQSLADRLALTTSEESDIRSALRAGFNLRWKANNDECDQCVQSGGRCGSSLQQSALFTCYCANESFLLTCNNRSLGDGSNGALQNNFYRKWKLVVGVSCGVTGITLLLFVIILCLGKRLLETQKEANHQIEMFIRNYGTLAPKRFKSFGGASHKSDVYSYGMLVLEMTGARTQNNSGSTSMSEAYFPDWIYKQVEVGRNLRDYRVTSEEEEVLARKMMIVSLWCIQSDPSDRPSIDKVVEMLEGSFESLQVPARRFESSPSRTFQGAPTSSMQSINSGDGKEDFSSSHFTNKNTIMKSIIVD
ncbi:hypothetical protein L1987_66250 [Smallanthus sonchifolius]|uniref:Uncharacterized protein n=1 Tax=Smallanthus sonchifolius TaxID=185202 RepID=A0ACB9BWW8_9ASTR|nr:hypothetical protein L1987_66250 [Smallanthus sonchifolius]